MRFWRKSVAVPRQLLRRKELITVFDPRLASIRQHPVKKGSKVIWNGTVILFHLLNRRHNTNICWFCEKKWRSQSPPLLSSPYLVPEKVWYVRKCICHFHSSRWVFVRKPTHSEVPRACTAVKKKPRRLLLRREKSRGNLSWWDCGVSEWGGLEKIKVSLLLFLPRLGCKGYKRSRLYLRWIYIYILWRTNER